MRRIVCVGNFGLVCRLPVLMGRKVSLFIDRLSIDIAAIIFLALLAFEHSAHAQTAMFDTNGKPIGCMDNQDPKKPGKVIPCPDSQLFVFEAQLPLEKEFNERKFSELDRLYDSWCEGKERFPDGRWKLAFFAPTFIDHFRTWQTWDLKLENIKAWQKSSPNSEAARLVEAVYWRSYAWNARDSGRSNSVSREGVALYMERMKRAKGLIDQISSKCAAKYAVQIDILRNIGAGDEDLRKVFTEAVGKFPEYHSIYFSMAPHFAPQSGGSKSQFEGFADMAANFTEKFEGSGMYARLYWTMDYNGGLPFSQKSGSIPKWPKLRKAFDDLMSRYPNSQHNLRQYLSVACRSTDSALYRNLRTKLGPYASAADMYDPLEVCDLRHKWMIPEGSR